MLIAVGVLLVVTFVIRKTVLGRRFVAVGASPAAARAAGIPVRAYELGTYIVAALAYGGAGILIAGFLRTPGIATGNDYLLPTIAAVVLGGTSLAGGRGSVIATAGGALFLTQLEQVVLGMGAPQLGPARHPGLDHRSRDGTAHRALAPRPRGGGTRRRPLRQRETPPRPPLPDLGDGGRP